MKYNQIWKSKNYSVEIYDNCRSYLEVRSDGQRARLTIAGTKWHGNTGGYHDYVHYIDGRNAVIEAMRRLRTGQILSLKNGYGRNDYYIAYYIRDGYMPGEYC